MKDSISKDAINHWADFWHYKRGINIFPLDIDKKTYENWSRYQEESIPDELYEEWKRTGRFAKGIILMPGKVWRGKNKGLYFVGFDFDKELGFKEFCNVMEINSTSIDELKQKFIVEQHDKDPNSFHIYFYSEIPFTDKSPDNVLGIEIKSNCKGLMCTTPSYHSETDSRWQIKGTYSPVILKSVEASKIMSRINDICNKFNLTYIKNGKDVTSTYLTPLIRQMILSLEINTDIIIHEGERHSTLMSIANSLLIRHKYNNNVSREHLKKFFCDINNKLCIPTPSPECEIESIWRDAIKFSEEKTAGIQFVSKDENDIQHYNTPIVIQLEKGNKLIEEGVVEDFVYDIQINSISYDLNHVYDRKKVIVPINIKKWDDVRKTLQKLCEEKGIKKEHILLLLEALDNNFDLIKKHYLENSRKHLAALTAAEERRKQRLEIIQEGTDFVMAKYRFLTIEESKDILYYDPKSGVYIYGGEIIIEKELDKKYGYKLKTADITEIKNYVIRKTYVKKDVFDSDIYIINVKNGLLNWMTKELLPHTPDYYSLNQKPILYNPNARSTKFLKFLKEVLYLQDVRTAIEIISYTFIRKNLFEYYFILIGTGANGKNVFVGILSHLHGLKSVSNVSLKSLATHRFALAQLENKDINVDTELSKNVDISNLKKLTGTQPVMVERKGRDPYDVELWAKYFFNTNELPIISDNSDARHRREIILSFPHQFEDGKNADPELLSKIINDEEEMSGTLNLLMNSLNVIHNNKKIHTKSTINQRRAKAELTADPVSAFLDIDSWTAASITKQAEEYITKDEFYGEFTKFCNDHKLHVLSYDSFAKKLKKEHKLINGRKIQEEDDNGNNKKKITIWFVKRLTDEEKAIKKEDEEEV